MEVTLHTITYASLLVFVLAVATRFLRIRAYPLHLRWEIYPIPHEGKRAEHGGSRYEEVDWWDKPRKLSRWTELKFMIPEMILLKALHEHNRKLWYRSFPFHFGLYLVAAAAFLLLLESVLSLSGVVDDDPFTGGAALLNNVTTVLAVAGLVLGILGGLGLLIMRLSDMDLKPYTNSSHIFNLLFIIVSFALALIAWANVDRDFSLMRGYITSLLTFDVTATTGSVWIRLAILALSVLVAYIPLTHMSHFFVKWFTWHKIRWDDEPNVKGGRIEIMIQKSLQAPVSWAADHINADGKKNWVDIATEEIEK